MDGKRQELQCNLVGDRTMAFIKEVKKSTNYGKSGIPALITHAVATGKESIGRSTTEKLTPMMDENETESIDRISSTPIVIKHLRPLTLSNSKSESQTASNFGGGFHTLPHVMPNTDTKSKSPRKFVEPVVIKRAFKF